MNYKKDKTSTDLKLEIPKHSECLNQAKFLKKNNK